MDGIGHVLNHFPPYFCLLRVVIWREASEPLDVKDRWCYLLVLTCSLAIID